MRPRSWPAAAAHPTEEGTPARQSPRETFEAETPASCSSCRCPRLSGTASHQIRRRSRTGFGQPALHHQGLRAGGRRNGVERHVQQAWSPHPPPRRAWRWRNLPNGCVPAHCREHGSTSPGRRTSSSASSTTGTVSPIEPPTTKSMIFVFGVDQASGNHSVPRDDW